MKIKNVAHFVSIILLLQFFIDAPLMAQTSNEFKGEISGRLIDEKSEPLPFANVVILDSTKKLLLGGISEETGKFKITNIPFGKLIVEISNFGYLPFSKEIELSASATKYNFEDIKLEPNLKVLNEIEVVGEKSSLILKKDKKIFNVGKDVLAQSSSAIEVLQNVPSVSVGVNGEVSLRGNSNVTVLINGRRSGLTLNNALEQIPAVSIESIEIITNPSSSYDASGSAGIINIILKKNKDEGVNGQISVRAGIPSDYRISPSINYKTKKLNFFTTLGYRYTDYIGTYTLKKKPNNLTATDYLSQLEDERRHDDGKSFYGGLDYYFNDKTSVTAAYDLSITKDTDKSGIDYKYYNYDALDSLLHRTGNSVENRSYNQIELSFLKNYNRKGRKFSTDFQYDFWNSTKDWDIRTSRETPSFLEGGKLRTNNINGNKDFVLQTDYETQLKSDKSKLEFGLKAEYRNVINNYLAESYTGNQWKTFNGLDNDLSYNENIGAAYIQYGNKIGKFDYMLGLRNEFTLVKIDDANKIFTRKMDYNNLFPTLSLGYTISEATSLQLSYSRRINRPSIWLLNPFNEIKDFTIQDAGNPELTPAYTDGIEFGFNKNFKKISLNSSLYYHRTQDFFQFYIYQDTTKAYITKPINLELENRYGFEASVNYNPIERLKFNLNLNYYSFDQKGSYNGDNLDFSNQFWELQFKTQVKLPRDINFQGFLHYRGKEINAQTDIKAIYYLDLSLNKSFLSNKQLIVAFNVSNVFNSNVERLLTKNENYILNRNSSRNAQRFNISVIYRLTNNPFKERRTKESNRN